MPEWFLIPGIAIATAAAIIASQALISGSFTLISEAIRLNLWPKKTNIQVKKDNFLSRPSIFYYLQVVWASYSISKSHPTWNPLMAWPSSSPC